MAGAPTKDGLFENMIRMVSLVNNFAASAKGWGSPTNPTLFGPFRV